MGYRLLGLAVWRGVKWYARRRARAARGKLVVAGASAALLTGAVVASRGSGND